MATASNLKAPPAYKEEDDYLKWKTEIEVWKMFMDTAAKKQGPAVYFTSTGRVCDTAPELSADEIG